MRPSWKPLIAALVSLVVVSATSGPVAEASGPSGRAARDFSPRTERALDEIIQTGMGASGTPGMAAGVWIPGRGRYVRAFGVADTTTGRPFQLDDHVRIASITKTMTATAILQLVDRHRIGLRDHLSSYVRGIPNGSQITIRQMLGMTAGIYDYTSDARFTKAFDDNPLMPFGPRDVIRIIKRHEPSFPPGEQVSYSDSNYALLGLVVSRVTKRPLGQVITNRILKPLGMTETSYPTTPAMPKPASRGYVPDSDGSLREVTRINPAVGGGAGAMISTLGDLRIWAKALATGALLTPETHRKQLMIKPFPGNQVLKAGYGLGILGINGLIGHNGAIYGYGSAMFYLPGRNATIVVEGNQSTNFSTIPTTVFIGIARYLFPHRFPASRERR